jgi:hypothetical protein
MVRAREGAQEKPEFMNNQGELPKFSGQNRETSAAPSRRDLPWAPVALLVFVLALLAAGAAYVLDQSPVQRTAPPQPGFPTPTTPAE